MVEAAPASPSERLKVFVSYSRIDLDFADQLVFALEDKGFDALVDRHDIDAAAAYAGLQGFRSEVFASAAGEREEQGYAAEAMLVALAARPAAAQSWFDHIFSLDSSHDARTALASAYTDNHLQRVRVGPEGTVTAFAQNAARAVSVRDDTAYVWDVLSERAVRTISLGTGKIRVADISPSGDRLLTSTYQNVTQLWDIQTGRQLLQAKGISATFSPDGSRILVGTYGSAQLIDVTGRGISQTHSSCSIGVDCTQGALC